uniref:Uncharacterized protein n=1 Tax=Romanomermis culicivorax TaxID=13658 RepID=A0A915J1G4_ROMCU
MLLVFPSLRDSSAPQNEHSTLLPGISSWAPKTSKNQGNLMSDQQPKILCQLPQTLEILCAKNHVLAGTKKH